MLIMNCNNMLSNCSEMKLNSNMKKNIFYIKFIGFYIPYIIREHFFLKEGPWEWVWVRYIFYGRERKSQGKSQKKISSGTLDRTRKRKTRFSEP